MRVEGENHFIIAPRPGGNLTDAAFRYESIYGLVESGWRQIDGKTVFSFSIPANCTATVILPDCAPREIQPGVYQMEA